MPRARSAIDAGTKDSSAIEEVVMKVKELMNPEVIAVEKETPLKEVAATLADHHISGVPVVDEARVVGVVSEADILVKERGPEPRHEGLIGWLLGGGVADAGKLAARTAGDAMTSPAITIRTRSRVSEAARLMTQEGVKRLPVVGPDGILVGIVTRADLVRAFARSDDDIEREIREDVVKRTLWLEDHALIVRVEHGEVTLAGELERRNDAELLSAFVERVPGVVSVRSEVAWVWDDRKGLARQERSARPARTAGEVAGGPTGNYASESARAPMGRRSRLLDHRRAGVEKKEGSHR
jgi:CBS domain-containing protein